MNARPIDHYTAAQLEADRARYFELMRGLQNVVPSYTPEQLRPMTEAELFQFNHPDKIRNALRFAASEEAREDTATPDPVGEWLLIPVMVAIALIGGLLMGLRP